MTFLMSRLWRLCVILCPRLTAFVMKSFGGAKPYIFIDPKLIVDSRTWLLSHRRQDGCITSVGKLFHNGMKVTWIKPKEPYGSKCIQELRMTNSCSPQTC